MDAYFKCIVPCGRPRLCRWKDEGRLFREHQIDRQTRQANRINVVKRNDRMFDTDKQTEFISPSQNPTEPPAQHPRHDRDGLRTGAIIGLTLLLVVFFVIGGFAGWVFANTKSNTAGTTASTTTATMLDTAREAVVANVKPSVGEVYATLAT